MNATIAIPGVITRFRGCGRFRRYPYVFIEQYIEQYIS